MESKKARALDALLESSTLTAAATAAGISRRTLYAWLHDDKEFANALIQRQRLHALEETERLQAARQQAMDVVATIMNDAKQSAAVRLKAAMKIIDAARDADRQADAIAMANKNDVEARESGFF